MIGDILSIQVLRSGQVLDLSVPLKSTVTQELIIGTNNMPPKYYIYQGLIFTTVTQQFIESFDGKFPIPELLPELMNNYRNNNQKEIVILAKVLPHATTYGYHHIGMETIETVNGVKVNDLNHLISLIETSEEPYIQMEIGYNGLYKLVLARHNADDITKTILEQYFIPFDRSKDLHNDN